MPVSKRFQCWMSTGTQLSPYWLTRLRRVASLTAHHNQTAPVLSYGPENPMRHPPALPNCNPSPTLQFHSVDISFAVRLGFSVLFSWCAFSLCNCSPASSPD